MVRSHRRRGDLDLRPGPNVLWKFTAGFAAGGLLWAAFFAWLTAALGCLLKERIARVLSMISALVFVDGYRRLL